MDFYPFSFYGNVSDYGWSAFYDYFKRIGIVKSKHFDKWLEFLSHDIYELVLFDDIAIVSRLHIYISRDTENRLHNDYGHSIEFKDGYKLYFLNGVAFDEELYWKIVKKQMPIIDVLKLDNIEQRYCAIKVYGAEEILNNLKAKKVHKDKKGNILYSINGVLPDKELKLLKYTCPSTGRIYTSFVPFEMEDAGEAMAWKFQITTKEYYSIKFES